MTIGVKVDWCWRILPWMRTTPFLALHIAHFGHRHYGGEQGSHRVYNIGLIWGRQFCGHKPGWAGMKWWHLTLPWVEHER